MGNCIRTCSQRKAGKREHRIEQVKSYQDKKFKVCREWDGVVRVKVLVSRKELEKLMKYWDNNRNKNGSMESILDAEMLKDGIGDWKPNLESIPEEYSIAC